MGWQDRDYNRGDFGEGGGFRRALRRIFVEGDDFFSWSLPLGRIPSSVPGIGGIQIRIHLLYIVFIIGSLLMSLNREGMGVGYSAAMMGTLFVLVLLHEFGHCLACRMVGGEADRILMWPLGGLAFCRPPHNWKAAFITTAGGPLVNVALVPVFGGALWLLGSGTDALAFNPFTPSTVLRMSWFDAYWKAWLWSAYYTNWALLAFNVLLIMFPLDGGRLFQEILWWRIGYRKSMLIAVNVGLVLAVCLGLFALMGGAHTNTLFGVAVFAGITCFVERRKLAVMEHDPILEDYDFSKGFQGMPDVKGKKYQNKPAVADRAYEAALKSQERERQRQADVDKILDKIRREGMGSLNRKEKAMLRDETERRKGQSA